MRRSAPTSRPSSTAWAATSVAEPQHKLGDVDLADAALYRHWKDHVLRFADLDPASHVNNVAYAEIFEAGRVAFGIDAGSRSLAPGTTTMVVRMTIDYLAQLLPARPGAVRGRPLRRDFRRGQRAGRSRNQPLDADARRPARELPRAV